MPQTLEGKKIAILATAGVERVELEGPRDALTEAGADVELLSLDDGEFEAGVASGRTLTSWPSLQTDLQNAGATWVDEEVVVDDGLVTSRKPDDIPAFSARTIEQFAAGGPS